MGPVSIDSDEEGEDGQLSTHGESCVNTAVLAMSQAGAPRCAVCGEEFASKNKLFSHLKGSGECARVTGRASLRGNAPGTAVGAQCPARAHVQGMEARG